MLVVAVTDWVWIAVISALVLVAVAMLARGPSKNPGASGCGPSAAPGATDDLLALRSDAYRLTDDARVELIAPQVPLVTLDSDHFKLLPDFEARFPEGPPSLKECERFEVEGDVRFGAGVVARGAVTVRQEGDGQRVIEDGAVLEG
jgi:hypothetical protein